MPNFTFIGAEMWECSLQNCQNLEFCAQICASGTVICAIFFNEILNICTCLQVACKFLIWLLLADKQPSYKHFPVVGAFSHKFSIAPSGETTGRIKKVKGCKMARTCSITVPSVMGIVGRAPAVDEKVLCFLSVCLSVCHALELRSL